MLRNLPLARRAFFWLAYALKRAPWDTNITPPELVEVIEGAEAPPPGSALDIGCGTGTNVVYLARHGWRAVGVDFVAAAIARAKEKARQAGVHEAARFLVGDVRKMPQLPLGGPFDLALDIGCFHGLPAAARSEYVAGLRTVLKPGATYLLYTFEPRDDGMAGITEDDVRQGFAHGFTIERVQFGTTRWDTRSAWFTMRRLV